MTKTLCHLLTLRLLLCQHFLSLYRHPPFGWRKRYATFFRYVYYPVSVSAYFSFPLPSPTLCHDKSVMSPVVDTFTILLAFLLYFLSLYPHPPQLWQRRYATFFRYVYYPVSVSAYISFPFTPPTLCHDKNVMRPFFATFTTLLAFLHTIPFPLPSSTSVVTIALRHLLSLRLLPR